MSLVGYCVDCGIQLASNSELAIHKQKVSGTHVTSPVLRRGLAQFSCRRRFGVSEICHPINFLLQFCDKSATDLHQTESLAGYSVLTLQRQRSSGFVEQASNQLQRQGAKSLGERLAAVGRASSAIDESMHTARDQVQRRRDEMAAQLNAATYQQDSTPAARRYVDREDARDYSGYGGHDHDGGGGSGADQRLHMQGHWSRSGAHGDGYDSDRVGGMRQEGRRFHKDSKYRDGGGDIDYQYVGGVRGHHGRTGQARLPRSSTPDSSSRSHRVAATTTSPADLRNKHQSNVRSLYSPVRERPDVRPRHYEEDDVSHRRGGRRSQRDRDRGDDDDDLHADDIAAMRYAVVAMSPPRNSQAPVQQQLRRPKSFVDFDPGEGGGDRRRRDPLSPGHDQAAANSSVRRESPAGSELSFVTGQSLDHQFRFDDDDSRRSAAHYASKSKRSQPIAPVELTLDTAALSVDDRAIAALLSLPAHVATSSVVRKHLKHLTQVRDMRLEASRVQQEAELQALKRRVQIEASEAADEADHARWIGQQKRLLREARVRKALAAELGPELASVIVGPAMNSVNAASSSAFGGGLGATAPLRNDLTLPTYHGQSATSATASELQHPNGSDGAGMAPAATPPQLKPPPQDDSVGDGSYPPYINASLPIYSPTDGLHLLFDFVQALPSKASRIQIAYAFYADGVPVGPVQAVGPIITQAAAALDDTARAGAASSSASKATAAATSNPAPMQALLSTHKAIDGDASTDVYLVVEVQRVTPEGEVRSIGWGACPLFRELELDTQRAGDDANGRRAGPAPVAGAAGLLAEDAEETPLFTVFGRALKLALFRPPVPIASQSSGGAHGVSIDHMRTLTPLPSGAAVFVRLYAHSEWEGIAKASAQLAAQTFQTPAAANSIPSLAAPLFSHAPQYWNPLQLGTLPPLQSKPGDAAAASPRSLAAGALLASGRQQQQPAIMKSLAPQSAAMSNTTSSTLPPYLGLIIESVTFDLGVGAVGTKPLSLKINVETADGAAGAAGVGPQARREPQPAALTGAPDHESMDSNELSASSSLHRPRGPIAAAAAAVLRSSSTTTTRASGSGLAAVRRSLAADVAPAARTPDEFDGLLAAVDDVDPQRRAQQGLSPDVGIDGALIPPPWSFGPQSATAGVVVPHPSSPHAYHWDARSGAAYVLHAAGMSASLPPLATIPAIPPYLLGSLDTARAFAPVRISASAMDVTTDSPRGADRRQKQYQSSSGAALSAQVPVLEAIKLLVRNAAMLVAGSKGSGGALHSLAAVVMAALEPKQVDDAAASGAGGRHALMCTRAVICDAKLLLPGLDTASARTLPTPAKASFTFRFLCTPQLLHRCVAGLLSTQSPAPMPAPGRAADVRDYSKHIALLQNNNRRGSVYEKLPATSKRDAAAPVIPTVEVENLASPPGQEQETQQAMTHAAPLIEEPDHDFASPWLAVKAPALAAGRMQLFDVDHGAFDVYIDGCRFLPDNVTLSKVVVKILGPDFTVIGPQAPPPPAVNSSGMGKPGTTSASTASTGKPPSRAGSANVSRAASASRDRPASSSSSLPGLAVPPAVEAVCALDCGLLSPTYPGAAIRVLAGGLAATSSGLDSAGQLPIITTPTGDMALLRISGTLDPACTILIRIDAVESHTGDVQVVGYALINPFYLAIQAGGEHKADVTGGSGTRSTSSSAPSSRPATSGQPVGHGVDTATLVATDMLQPGPDYLQLRAAAGGADSSALFTVDRTASDAVAAATSGSSRASSGWSRHAPVASHGSATKLKRHATSHQSGPPPVCLNEGAFQLPLHQGPPVRSGPLSIHSLADVATVPCSTVLVRLCRVGAFGTLESVPAALPAPAYGSKAYDSQRCEPVEAAEMALYPKRADVHAPAVGSLLAQYRSQAEAVVAAGGSGAGALKVPEVPPAVRLTTLNPSNPLYPLLELLPPDAAVVGIPPSLSSGADTASEWIKARLAVAQPSRMLDFGYICPYDPLDGFKVRVDGCHIPADVLQQVLKEGVKEMSLMLRDGSGTAPPPPLATTVVTAALHSIFPFSSSNGEHNDGSNNNTYFTQVREWGPVVDHIVLLSQQLQQGSGGATANDGAAVAGTITASGPRFKDGYTLYSGLQFEANAFAMIDVRATVISIPSGGGEGDGIRTSRVRSIGWTLLPLFDQRGEGYVARGAYALPLFVSDSPPATELLEAIQTSQVPLHALMRQLIGLDEVTEPMLLPFARAVEEHDRKRYASMRQLADIIDAAASDDSPGGTPVAAASSTSSAAVTDTGSRPGSKAHAKRLADAAAAAVALKLANSAGGSADEQQSESAATATGAESNRPSAANGPQASIEPGEQQSQKKKGKLASMLSRAIGGSKLTSELVNAAAAGAVSGGSAAHGAIGPAEAADRTTWPGKHRPILRLMPGHAMVLVRLQDSQLHGALSIQPSGYQPTHVPIELRKTYLNVARNVEAAAGNAEAAAAISASAAPPTYRDGPLGGSGVQMCSLTRLAAAAHIHVEGSHHQAASDPAFASNISASVSALETLINEVFGHELEILPNSRSPSKY